MQASAGKNHAQRAQHGPDGCLLRVAESAVLTPRFWKIAVQESAGAPLGQPRFECLIEIVALSATGKGKKGEDVAKDMDVYKNKMELVETIDPEIDKPVFRRPGFEGIKTLGEIDERIAQFIRNARTRI